MKVIWTPEARRDRADIWDLIEAQDTNAAARMDQLFSDAVSKLADFPMLGHAGEVAGTRELTPHKSYRLVYEIVDDAIWVLVLIHAARQWPPARS